MRICHCHDVSDRDLELSLQSGARNLAQVCRATRAGTCCGGCVPAVREIVQTHTNPSLAMTRSRSMTPSLADPDSAHGPADHSTADHSTADQMRTADQPSMRRALPTEGALPTERGLPTERAPAASTAGHDVSRDQPMVLAEAAE